MNHFLQIIEKKWLKLSVPGMVSNRESVCRSDASQISLEKKMYVGVGVTVEVSYYYNYKMIKIIIYINLVTITHNIRDFYRYLPSFVCVEKLR